MAQEDTELRDLVIEALEKNGSLAKVRALLRANVFLAFENECENMKQNMRLDKILKSPEGIVALSIVHEFLEFCNLKNTLFVYMAESRQKKEYFYQGKKILSEKLKLNCHGDKVDEPLLVSLIKKSLHLGNGSSPNANEKSLSKDEQNCTYIVHEDSGSAASSSQSDSSSDEKNKLHLRLQLDNSDTDTSSDSTRDKQCSEYIPSEHIIQDIPNNEQDNSSKIPDIDAKQKDLPGHCVVSEKDEIKTPYLYNLKPSNNSSDSTSYIDLKSSFVDVKNATEIQKEDKIKSNEVQERESQLKEQVNIQNMVDIVSPTSISNISTLSKNDTLPENSVDNSHEKPVNQKSNSEYSLDFTSSLNRDKLQKNQTNKMASEDVFLNTPNKNPTLDSSQHNSPRSLSSISVDDIADLILSESIASDQQPPDNASKSKLSPGSSPNRINNLDSNKISDDSGDFSESPIPSLSNLSLDIHSD